MVIGLRDPVLALRDGEQQQVSHISLTDRGLATTREFDSRHAQESGNPRATRRTDFDSCVAAGWLRPVDEEDGE
jgi:hypothetical protein